MQIQVQGAATRQTGALTSYDPGAHFCELCHCVAQSAHGALIQDRLSALGLAELIQRARAAEAELYNQGITFTIYSDGDAIDRILPFDVIPRLITAADWAVIEAGVRQRVQTLNLFLADIYGPQEILAEGIIENRPVLAAQLVLGRVGIVHVVRRIGEGHAGQFTIQHLLDIGQHGGVTTQHPVLAADPQIAGAADRIGGWLRHLIRVIDRLELHGQQPVEFGVVEAK